MEKWIRENLEFPQEDQRVIEESIKQLLNYKQTKAIEQSIKEIEGTYFYNRIVLVKGIPLVNKDKEEKFIEVFSKSMLQKLGLMESIIKIQLGLNEFGQGLEELYIYFDSFENAQKCIL